MRKERIKLKNRKLMPHVSGVIVREHVTALAEVKSSGPDKLHSRVLK